MKSLFLIGIATAMATPAVAQMTPPTTSTTTTPMTTPPADATATDGNAAMPMPEQGGTMAPATNGTMQNGTMAPAPTMAPMASNPAPAAPESYPKCSRTVTDGCKQDGARASDTPGGPPAHPRRHRRPR